MKTFKTVIFLLSFFVLGIVHASGPMGKSKGVEYTYSNPEMFFTTPHELKLSVNYDILNCFVWEDGVPVDKCFNFEFYVINKVEEMGNGHLFQEYISDIMHDDCQLPPDDGDDGGDDGDDDGGDDTPGEGRKSGTCEAIIKLPLAGLLNPAEYASWLQGEMIEKKLKLFLAYAGEEDDFGRTLGREISDICYKLHYVLNGTGFGSVAIIKFEMKKHCSPPAPPAIF